MQAPGLKTCSSTCMVRRRTTCVDEHAAQLLDIALRAIVVKEFIQMRRDRVTFGMMVGIPIIQLILFGFAINSDPKHLPTAVLVADNGPHGAHVARTALANSDYFRLRPRGRTSRAAKAETMLARGEVQFVVNIPQDFTPRSAAGRAAGDSRRGRRHRSRGHGQCDAALCAARDQTALRARSQRAAGASCGQAISRFELRIHRRYNPEANHPVQHRARPDGRRADHDDGDDHRGWPSRANGSAAPWRICSRCRRARLR